MFKGINWSNNPINTGKTDKNKDMDMAIKELKQKITDKVLGEQKTRETPEQTEYIGYASSREKERSVKPKKKKDHNKPGQPWLQRGYYRYYRGVWSDGHGHYKQPHPWHIACVADYQLGQHALFWTKLALKQIGKTIKLKKEFTDWRQRKLPKLKIYGRAYRIVDL